MLERFSHKWRHKNGKRKALVEQYRDPEFIVSALAPTIGALTHLTLGVEETNAIAVTIVGIMTVVSSIVAIDGRITATEKIETPKLIQKIKGLTYEKHPASAKTRQASRSFRRGEIQAGKVHRHDFAADAADKVRAPPPRPPACTATTNTVTAYSPGNKHRPHMAFGKRKSPAPFTEKSVLSDYSALTGFDRAILTRPTTEPT